MESLSKQELKSTITKQADQIKRYEARLRVSDDSMAALTLSLSTLTAEKALMEEAFQADKKVIRDKYENLIASMREETKSLAQQHLAEINNLKAKISYEIQEREKERADHAAMMKELHLKLNTERKSKEKLEDKAVHSNESHASQVEQEKRVGDLSSSLEAAQRRLQRPEETVETPALLVRLQNKVALLEQSHSVAIREEQMKTKRAEEAARRACAVQDERVSLLESKLAELSDTVGRAELTRRTDATLIQNLKDELNGNLTQGIAVDRTQSHFEENSTPKKSETDNEKLADREYLQTLIDTIHILKKEFMGKNDKLGSPIDVTTIFNDKVKTLEINTQKRLEGVVDLIFEKAIDEPHFSVVYAVMCNKLSTLKVPANNPTNPDQCVNFRALIINKCQNQFETNETHAQVLKLEKDFNECTDPVKKKELQLMLNEENRRVRMRSVGNVRFIGELYNLKMLTCKIMIYCMNCLIEKLEEEKLECLCTLLSTIGEQVENDDSKQLDVIFKRMQDIVDQKPPKISSHVWFMIQDVISLRRRRWVVKSVVDSQPEMMDQIQKKAEQQQRYIELMNASPMGGGGSGGRGKRGGDGRLQNASMDNTWKTPTKTTNVKAVSQENLNYMKLATHRSSCNHGSVARANVQGSTNPQISLSKNMSSVLDDAQADNASFKANRD